MKAKTVSRWTHLVAAAPCFFLPLATLPTDFEFTTVASWYGPGFHGRKTASGEIYDQNKMTAANKTLPFGTKLTVKNLTNGRSCIVVINDRGPYVHGRGIDLSKEAARRIGMNGTAPVLCRNAVGMNNDAVERLQQQKQLHQNQQPQQDRFESVSIAALQESISMNSHSNDSSGSAINSNAHSQRSTRTHRALARTLKRSHHAYSYVAYLGSKRVEFGSSSSASKFVRNYRA